MYIAQPKRPIRSEKQLMAMRIIEIVGDVP